MHLKANYITTLLEGCPNSKAPPNAATNASFFSLFLEDAPLLSFVASHIPRFFVLSPEKKVTIVKSSGADLIMIIMVTLLWVQITGLPTQGALLTRNIPAAGGADGATSLPPESAGLKRKSKITGGNIFLLSTRLFTLTFLGLGGRNHDIRVRVGTSGDTTRKYSEG